MTDLPYCMGTGNTWNTLINLLELPNYVPHYFKIITPRLGVADLITLDNSRNYTPLEIQIIHRQLNGHSLITGLPQYLHNQSMAVGTNTTLINEGFSLTSTGHIYPANERTILISEKNLFEQPKKQYVAPTIVYMVGTEIQIDKFFTTNPDRGLSIIETLRNDKPITDINTIGYNSLRTAIGRLASNQSIVIGPQIIVMDLTGDAPKVFKGDGSILYPLMNNIVQRGGFKVSMFT